MKLTLTRADLCNLIVRQINHFFPDSNVVKERDIFLILDDTLEKLEYCFKHVDNKYFQNEGEINFDHLHGDQYSMFLYILSRASFLILKDVSLAKKTYLLNKSLFGLDVYYEVELPSIFLFVHPVGTVLGRAKYSDYLVVYQRVGIGSNHNVYPKLGKNLTLHPGASILGNSKAGDNCTIGADSMILDTNLPDNSLYVGGPGNHSIRTGYVSATKFWKM